MDTTRIEVLKLVKEISHLRPQTESSHANSPQAQPDTVEKEGKGVTVELG